MAFYWVVDLNKEINNFTFIKPTSSHIKFDSTRHETSTDDTRWYPVWFDTSKAEKFHTGYPMPDDVLAHGGPLATKSSAHRPPARHSITPPQPVATPLIQQQPTPKLLVGKKPGTPQAKPCPETTTKRKQTKQATRPQQQQTLPSSAQPTASTAGMDPLPYEPHYELKIKIKEWLEPYTDDPDAIDPKGPVEKARAATIEKYKVPIDPIGRARIEPLFNGRHGKQRGDFGCFDQHGDTTTAGETYVNPGFFLPDRMASYDEKLFSGQPSQFFIRDEQNRIATRVEKSKETKEENEETGKGVIRPYIPRRRQLDANGVPIPKPPKPVKGAPKKKDAGTAKKRGGDEIGLGAER